jgi:hypothetical protein
MYFRFHILIVIAGFLSLIETGNAEVPEWEGRFLETIKEHHGDDSDEAIQALSRIVGMLSRENKPDLRKSPAFKLARESLLEIPGFAENLRNRILEISAWELGESTIKPQETRGFLFQTLTQLPHPETIRVLGALLQDDRDPTNGLVTDTRYVPNSVNAAYSLHGIGLRNPPVTARYGDAWQDLPTWRLWYEQVQHGKPFSFEGDPRTFTLAENSLAAADRQEHRRRPDEGESAKGSDHWVSKPEVWVILLLVLLTVTVAASRFLRTSGRS